MMDRFRIPREIVVVDNEATSNPEHTPFKAISISTDESTVYQGTTVSENSEEEEEDSGIGGFAIFWIFVLLIGLAVILPKDSITKILSSSVTPENPILAMGNSPNVPTMRPTTRPSTPSRKPTRERPPSQPTIPVSQPQKIPDLTPAATASGRPLFKHESEEVNGSFSTQTSDRPTRRPSTSPTRTPSYSLSEFSSHGPTTKRADSLIDNNSDHQLIGNHRPRPREYEEFSFYAMGDIPYANRDVKTLQNQVRDLNHVYLNDKAKFVVHVGDMQSGMDSKCEQSFYARVQKIFVDESPLPTMVLAGDNDWNNCPSPPAAWYNYASHFIGLEQLWNSGDEIAIKRWNEERPENFVSFVNGVLVLSVNLVGLPILSPTEWDKRTADNVLWVRNNVDSYFRTEGEIRAVVIFGHSRYRAEIHPFFAGIRSIFMSDAFSYRTGLKIPVIYLHGDGHQFEISSIPSLNWDQFNTVMVDQGKNAPPLKVEIAGKNDLNIEGGNQYVLGNGLIRIDRRGGLYT